MYNCMVRAFSSATGGSHHEVTPLSVKGGGSQPNHEGSTQKEPRSLISKGKLGAASQGRFENEEKRSSAAEIDVSYAGGTHRPQQVSRPAGTQTNTLQHRKQR